LVTLSDKGGLSMGSRQQPRWKAPMIILIDLSFPQDGYDGARRDRG